MFGVHERLVYILQEKKIGLGEEGVQVFHFYELCSSILGEKIHYENEDNDYYELIILEALENIKKEESLVEPFDAIFVDEAQDFSNEANIILLVAETDEVYNIQYLFAFT